MKKEKGIDFSLVGIRTEQFATFGDKMNEKEEIQLQTGLGFRVNNENKQVGVYIKIEFIQNEKPKIIIETSNYFTVALDSWEGFRSKENALIIPKDFAIHLVGLSIGTTRGVLHAKIENTAFNHYFLPIIAVKDLVTEDIELSLDKENNS